MSPKNKTCAKRNKKIFKRPRYYIQEAFKRIEKNIFWIKLLIKKNLTKSLQKTRKKRGLLNLALHYNTMNNKNYLISVATLTSIIALFGYLLYSGEFIWGKPYMNLFLINVILVFVLSLPYINHTKFKVIALFAFFIFITADIQYMNTVLPKQVDYITQLFVIIGPFFVKWSLIAIVCFGIPIQLAKNKPTESVTKALQ